jgi:dTDP-4-amino-4,6-dideoxygalactose transaminase
LQYYREQGYREDATPVAARVGRQTVTLPLFPAMAAEDVARVVHELKAILT